MPTSVELDDHLDLTTTKAGTVGANSFATDGLEPTELAIAQTPP